MSKTLLVVAGEVSGDMHAASVLAALRKEEPDLTTFGIGGDRCREEGMEVLHHVKEMSVFGLPEVLKRYTFFRRVFDEMVRVAAERKPDAALLVDYGGFNIRYAARLKKLGIKVLYYVCPQVWASRRSRMEKLVRHVDRLMVIFPFEKDLFEGSGLRVDFVGHPLVDVSREPGAGTELPWQGPVRIGLLPGSREQEVRRILPVMCQTAALLASREAGTTYLVASPSPQITDVVRSVLDAQPARPERLDVIEGRTRDVLRQAKVAMVASGTATVEAALVNCPSIIVYKTTWLIYALARSIIRVPHIGMVNVIAGRTVFREFIQHQANAETMADTLEPLLGETRAREKMLMDLEDVRERLGEGGAPARVAEIVLEEV